MAKGTDVNLRSKSIYSVYIRNHTKEGTFNAFVEDLDRIKSLGTDIIWLLPIHPIGVENKKGDLGCPYSVRNYRKINPEYGTLDDFIRLVDEVHKRGMKLVMDIVLGHTAHDSRLFETNPEFFHRREDGSYGCKIGDWSDIIDLDYSNRMLWEHQLETLKMWAEYVDGFRCDVASVVPLDFWKIARTEINSKKPDFFWLAESVDGNFIKTMRDEGYEVLSDGELYSVFDCCYDYDVKWFFEGYFDKSVTLERYIEELNRQEVMYPQNYIKLRFLENHDTLRIAGRADNEYRLVNLTAFMYFEKGMPMLYAGQETSDKHTPSLFDKDEVCWDGNDLSELIKNLMQLKKQSLFVNGAYRLSTKNGIVFGEYKGKNEKIIGIFNFENQQDAIDSDLADGIYKNMIDQSDIKVSGGRIERSQLPVIIHSK